MREGDQLSFGCGTTIQKNDQPHWNPFVFVCKGLQGAFDAARLRLSSPVPAQGPTQETAAPLADAAPPAPGQHAQQAQRAGNEMTPAQAEVQLPAAVAEQAEEHMATGAAQGMEASSAAAPAPVQQQPQPLPPPQQQPHPLLSPNARRLVDLTLPAAARSRPAANGGSFIVDLTGVSPFACPGL